MSKIMVNPNQLIKEWLNKMCNCRWDYVRNTGCEPNSPGSDSTVSHLNINDRCEKIHDIIDNLDCFENLENLFIANCILGNFPEQITKFQTLKELSFIGIKTNIPDSISLLKNLCYLSIKNNDLESIPDTLGELKSLDTFDCSENKIKELPLSICMLDKLETINCSNNQLTELPDDIGMMSSLRKIHCKSNQISKLPLSFKDLNNMKDVDFSNNLFTDIPLLLFEMDLDRALFIKNKIKIRFQCSYSK